MNDDKIKVLANQMMSEEDSMERTHMAMEISHLLDMEGTERGDYLFMPWQKDSAPVIDSKIWVLHFCYDYAYEIYVKKSILPENSIFL